MDMALIQIRNCYPDLYLIHYMDDILLAHPNREILQLILEQTINSLQEYGLKIAPEKIQVQPPFNYLGRVLYTDCVTHQPFTLRVDKLTTLNDFQKLLGDINWIRPYLKLTTGELSELFAILQGDSDPRSPRQLTEGAKLALQKIELAITNSVITRLEYTQPWQLIVLKTAYTPTAVLWQNNPLEWIHLPHTPAKILPSYPLQVAKIILKGRKRSKELFGYECSEIIIPYTKEQFESLLQNDEDWQVAMIGLSG